MKGVNSPLLGIGVMCLRSASHGEKLRDVCRSEHMWRQSRCENSKFYYCLMAENIFRSRKNVAAVQPIPGMFSLQFEGKLLSCSPWQRVLRKLERDNRDESNTALQPWMMQEENTFVEEI